MTIATASLSTCQKRDAIRHRTYTSDVGFAPHSAVSVQLFCLVKRMRLSYRQQS